MTAISPVRLIGALGTAVAAGTTATLLEFYPEQALQLGAQTGAIVCALLTVAWLVAELYVVLKGPENTGVDEKLQIIQDKLNMLLVTQSKPVELVREDAGVELGK
jgi:hypothetical protein